MANNELPEGWTTATIGDTAEYINGRGFKKSEWEGEGRPIIRIQNLTGTAEDFNYTTLDVDEKYVIPPETILVSWSATLDTFRWHGPEGVLNQHIFKVVPNEELVDEDFLFWLLKREIQEMVRSAKLQGSTMKHIRRDSFLDHEFPLPPKPEQQRIADRIDAIQSRTQATGETLSQVPDRIEEYRQSVLNAAFTGQLTADWREDHPDVEPADELLERILDERRSHWEKNYRAKYEAKGKEPPSGWKSRYSEPESFETNEELFDIPDEWIWTNLAHLAISGPQNGLYLPKSEYGSGTPILRIDDYQIGWSRSAEELQKVEAEKDDIEKYSLNVGDLVINRVNSVSHLGKSLLVEERNIPSLFESNMMRLRPTSLGSRYYLTFYLQSAGGRRLLIRNAKHAVNQASINQGDVKGTPVPLPPGEEQKEIVRRIRQRLDKIDEMAQHVEQASERLDHLDRSVLAKAFCGELVETEAERARREDRDYETAEELLERVQGDSSSDGQSTSSENKSPTTTQVGDDGQIEMKVVEDDPDL